MVRFRYVNRMSLYYLCSFEVLVDTDKKTSLEIKTEQILTKVVLVYGVISPPIFMALFL